jgi:2-hydroxychromene-2-carboxylate isomerase
VSSGKKLRAKLFNAYISEGTRRRARAWHEAKRRLTGGAHTVTAFLQLDDPYSYLLSRYLPALAEHYDIDLQVRLSAALGGDFHPAPELLAEYAITDCARVAAELGLPFLDQGPTPPAKHYRSLLDAIAARMDEGPDELYRALELYWRGDAEAAARIPGTGAQGKGDALLATSQEELRQLGHYNSAMLHYGGEWYWGVDRLHYLLRRLDEQGLARDDSGNARLASIQQVMHVDLPVMPPGAAKDLPPLDLFYSFRSPYSHLCVQRAGELADAFGLQLMLRPVLPMMMRGMAVPRSKIRYILRDAAREAETLGVPFGNAIDPLGEGVERCLAVFAYALEEHRSREFLQNASDMIWAGGVDVATDKGMRKITGKTGLFWPEVKQALEKDDWREAEAENRQLMLSFGTWGVPTLCVGDYAVWGQDRIWLLARHLEELCDTGEGILV